MNTPTKTDLQGLAIDVIRAAGFEIPAHVVAALTGEHQYSDAYLEDWGNRLAVEFYSTAAIFSREQNKNLCLGLAYSVLAGHMCHYEPEIAAAWNTMLQRSGWARLSLDRRPVTFGTATSIAGVS